MKKRSDVFTQTGRRRRVALVIRRGFKHFERQRDLPFLAKLGENEVSMSGRFLMQFCLAFAVGAALPPPPSRASEAADDEPVLQEASYEFEDGFVAPDHALLHDANWEHRGQRGGWRPPHGYRRPPPYHGGPAYYRPPCLWSPYGRFNPGGGCDYRGCWYPGGWWSGWPGFACR